jgi:triosephosphate isomerase
MIVINLKTYKEAFGERAVEIAKACEELSLEYGVRIVLCPQTMDIRLIKEQTNAEIFAQHVDPIPFGRFTGWINSEALNQIGIKGTLINHSEHRLNFEEIKERIEKCKTLKWENIVCVANIEEGKKILGLHPNYIAIEPPELIGSDISVSTAKPELIQESVKALSNDYTKLLVGAGIRTENDVKVALGYKASGILSASEIAKSSNPKESLRNFVKAFSEILPEKL